MSKKVKTEHSIKKAKIKEKNNQETDNNQKTDNIKKSKKR